MMKIFPHVYIDKCFYDTIAVSGFLSRFYREYSDMLGTNIILICQLLNVVPYNIPYAKGLIQFQVWNDIFHTILLLTK